MGEDDKIQRERQRYSRREGRDIVDGDSLSKPQNVHKTCYSLKTIFLVVFSDCVNILTLLWVFYR